MYPIPLSFWQSDTGKEPVREFLHSLPFDDKKIVGRDLSRLQFGWPIRMPLVRKLRGAIWELRCSVPSKRELRVLFTSDNYELILLHVFIKKMQKTPIADLELAVKRSREIRNDIQ